MSWWGAGRREELQAVGSRCQDEARAAQALRSELLVRLSPRAFQPESAAVAIEASRYTFFLYRFLPRWRVLRRQVAAWYPREAPPTQSLLNDLGKLAQCHRHLDYCRQVDEHYADDLLRDAQGKPDWPATLEALEGLDRLEKVGKVPKSLQAVLSDERALDRQALAAAAKTLREQARALSEQAGVVNRDYDLGEIACKPDARAREQSQDEINKVQRETAFLNSFCGLLRPGQDIPHAEVKSRCSILAELAGLRGQASNLRQQLSLTEDVQAGVRGGQLPLDARVRGGQLPLDARVRGEQLPLDEGVRGGQLPLDAVEARDWSPLARQAEALLALLASWGRPLADHEARAITDVEVRYTLEGLIRRAEAINAEDFPESWQFLEQLFDPKRPAAEGVVIEQTPLSQLRRWLAARVAQVNRLPEWAQFVDLGEVIREAGVGPMLDEVRSGQVRIDEAADAFSARFLSLWLDALHARVPALRQFTGVDHDHRIAEFRDLDRRSIAAAHCRVRQQLLEQRDKPRSNSGEPPASSELGILLREVNKKRRHLPLRRLFAYVPRLLLKLKPCLMMSPLAVSTYLEARDITFDLVIFDEASQVRPHDAICAIYRGNQVMVAGDQKQLPPTNFFERAAESDEVAAKEGEGETYLRDFESILDVCCTLNLPRYRLRWHYRSRREGLIAFANHHVYDNDLITFPSVEDTRDNPPVAFEYVDQGCWKAGAGGGFNAIEARRTAELVLEHFRQRPGLTLGVIAFSQRQQERIRDELEKMRRGNPDLEEFFHEEGRSTSKAGSAGSTWPSRGPGWA
jgi:hypothetical protein